MIETLAQITAPHFCAGIVLWDDKVIEAALKKQKWTRRHVREYCKRKGWTIEVVHELQRTRT